MPNKYWLSDTNLDLDSIKQDYYDSIPFMFKNTPHNQPFFLLPDNLPGYGQVRVYAEDLRLSAAHIMIDANKMGLEATIAHRRWATAGDLESIAKRQVVADDIPSYTRMVYEHRMYMKSEQDQYLCLIDYIEHFPGYNVTRWARPRFNADIYSNHNAPFLTISDTKIKLEDRPSSSFLPQGFKFLHGPDILPWLQQARAAKGAAADHLPEITVRSLHEEPDTCIARSQTDFLMIQTTSDLAATYLYDPPPGPRNYAKQNSDTLHLFITPCNRAVIVDQRNTAWNRSTNYASFNPDNNRTVKVYNSLSEALHGSLRGNKAAPELYKKVNAAFNTQHTYKPSLLQRLGA